MIWNVFFVVFAILVLVAIGLTVWFLKLGKRIFLLIPLLLLAGSVAYFAVYYTADNNFPPAQVMIASNFPSTVDSALVEESLQKADGNYTRTDEYDTAAICRQVAQNIGADKVFAFNYDWRLDACETAAKLADFVSQVKAKTGVVLLNIAIYQKEKVTAYAA